MKNPIEQLTEWVNDETIGIREFSVIYRNKMRRKYAATYGDILGGRGENYPGLMLRMFESIRALEGAFDLQHLRDTQMKASAEEVKP